MRLAATFLALLSLPALANAQAVCDTREAIFARAEANYGQVPTLQATDSTGHTVHVLVNPDDMSWTIAVDHGPQTCVYVWGVDLGLSTVPQGEAL